MIYIEVIDSTRAVVEGVSAAISDAQKVVVGSEPYLKDVETPIFENDVRTSRLGHLSGRC